MSVRPQPPNANQPPIPRKKVTLNTLNTLYKNKTPISMVTAYDYPTALAASSSILTDLILVGDSLAQVCLGYPSTNELTLDEVIHHARAVARGTTHPFTIADMPFGSYHISVEQAVTNAIRLVKEGRVESVKLEGGAEVAPIVRKLVEVGIPVMSHIGLQPQKHISLSGYKVQGKTVESARKLIEDALTLQDAGAYSTLVEAVPKELGAYVTEKLRIPTIGIGAGPGTSGQVLVIDDLLGSWSGHKAKFVRRFANLKEVRDSGIHSYAEAVRDGSFPNPESESYTMDSEEWERFLASERREGRLS
ncbi:ketopantoate hydroxymethyltransferase [Coprinellus micaceus]|uniref:3-methyl-2-oxobutanoate hydroxymethyltransferase n=1 Tax=Coprinellus micaceus TaxID=71717 RepID=A0A4Y7U0X2_COPMI|nr:ketopantoate hydroxymethyltransferase [Coprinellus micaceus]